jgi:hypothetical protein
VRLNIDCPLCGEKIDIPITIIPKIVFTQGNGPKGFVTADVGAGGIEHTCRQLEPAPTQEAGCVGCQ